MDKMIVTVTRNMKELGLGALLFANRLAVLQDTIIDKWEELSFLQVCSAFEFLANSKILEENQVSMICEWNLMLRRLTRLTDISFDINQLLIFYEVRRELSMFGRAIRIESLYLQTLKFIYEIIDPFIYNCWGLYAVDYILYENEYEDDDKTQKIYLDLIKKLISNEIKFLVSEKAAEYISDWEHCLEFCSFQYKNSMRKRINDIINL